MYHPAQIFKLKLIDAYCSPADLNNSFVDFCIYFNKLTKQYAKSTIQDRQLIDVILLKDDLSNKNTFQKHIYAANATFQRLYKRVFASNIKVHTHILTTLLFDVYHIIAIAEDFENNGDPLGLGHRDKQSGREIFDASRFIYNIQEIDTSNAYLREVTPASIFLIRQSLEVLGKNCLGFHSITSASKQRYKNTQVAWEFITLDQKSEHPKIYLPIDISIINKMIVWTNSYIHTGDLKEYYVIENILECLLKLYFDAGRRRVPNYQNMLVGFGVIRVSNYSLLKRDFENYINKHEYSFWKNTLIKLRLAKPQIKWQVNWFPPEKVWEATIVSL